MKHGAYQVLCRNDLNLQTGCWTFTIVFRDDSGKDIEQDQIVVFNRDDGFDWLENHVQHNSGSTMLDYLHPDEIALMLSRLNHYRTRYTNTTRIFSIFGQFEIDPSATSPDPAKPVVARFKTSCNSGTSGASFILGNPMRVLLFFDPKTDVYSGGTRMNISGVSTTQGVSINRHYHVTTGRVSSNTGAPDDTVPEHKVAKEVDLLDLVTF